MKNKSSSLWQELPIKKVSTFLTDYEANGSFSDLKNNVEVYAKENYAWYVRATDLEKNNLPPTDGLRYVDKKSYEFLRKTSLYGDELLLSKRGQIGKIYLMPNIGSRATLAPNLYLLKLDNCKITTKFLYYYFKSYFGQKKLFQKTTSTTLQALYKDDLNSILIPVPPLVEQRGIAEVLGTVDEAIGATEQVIEKTELLKRGLMQRLLIEGIGHTEYKQTQRGGIPKTWKITTIESISTLVTDGVHKTPNYITEGIPFISVTNFKNGTIDWGSAKYILKHQHDELIKRCNPEKGDVILTKVGTLGLTYVIKENFEFSIFVQLALIKPKHDLINNIFLKYVLDSHELQKAIKMNSSGSTLKYIGINKIKKLKIPLPPRKEQNKIAEILSFLDSGLQKNNKHKNELMRLKEGLMQVLLSGERRVELREDGLYRIG